MKHVLLILFTLSGCVAKTHDFHLSAMPTDAKSICELIDSREIYVGRRVVIAATFGEGPHQRFLYDDGCSNWLVGVSNSSRRGNLAAIRLVKKSFEESPTAGIPVIYSGVLESHIVISGCSKPTCYSYSLVDGELLAAFPRLQHTGRR
jgi:hypothetical protein